MAYVVVNLLKYLQELVLKDKNKVGRVGSNQIQICMYSIMSFWAAVFFL